AIAADIRFLLGLTILDEQAIALALGLALSVVFLTIPMGRMARAGPPPVHDVVLAAVALAAGCWVAFRFAAISANFFDHRTEAFVASLILIPLVFEALRRTAGWPLVIILAAFLGYGLFGDLIPGTLKARVTDFYRLFAYLTGDNVALLGLPLKIIVTIVVMFMVMGQLLARSGGSQWFTDISMSLMGRTRGGPAKIAVTASALFGSISGSAVSNVASTGVITIPLMKRSGYSAISAGALEAVASTGGQIMPPIMGAAAFLMAEFLEASYAEVILAALVPSLLYYVSVFVQADLEAARNKFAPISAEEIEPIGKVLAGGWYFLAPFVVLIVALFRFNKTPTEAALWASVVLLVVGFRGYRGNRLTPSVVLASLKTAGQTSVGIIVIGAMSGLIIGLIERSGLGFGLTFLLVQVGEQSLLLLLLLTALVSIILGMGMPTTAIYFLVATLAAPPLIKLGVNPFAAHLFVLYFGLLSLITPPVAIAAFTAASMAGGPPMRTAVTAVRYGWPAFVLPFVFVMAPALIGHGTTIEVLRAVAAASVGIWVVSLGIAGWFAGGLGLSSRILLVAAGAAMLAPPTVVRFAWVDLAGALLAALVIGGEVIANRRAVGRRR
ncbi:MAG: TRAP transporter fused permease subunit, partial [Alphaproteobacteria bacterium]|nr:TRAP transporter fused permease subunit [Alphaproteobacteria bacterium]